MSQNLILIKHMLTQKFYQSSSDTIKLKEIKINFYKRKFWLSITTFRPTSDSVTFSNNVFFVKHNNDTTRTKRF